VNYDEYNLVEEINGQGSSKEKKWNEMKGKGGKTFWLNEQLKLMHP
jgi:hypothetical protein